MRLSRASCYALHAMAFLANSKKDENTASYLIAEKKAIPERFLLKVLKPLVTAQVLTSVKGPNGGYRLARPAQEISVLEVIEAVDGPIRGHAPKSHHETSSVLNKKLDQMCNQAADQIRKTLGKIKLTELIGRE